MIKDNIKTRFLVYGIWIMIIGAFVWYSLSTKELVNFVEIITLDFPNVFLQCMIFAGIFFLSILPIYLVYINHKISKTDFIKIFIITAVAWIIFIIIMKYFDPIQMIDFTKNDMYYLKYNNIQPSIELKEIIIILTIIFTHLILPPLLVISPWFVMKIIKK